MNVRIHDAVKDLAAVQVPPAGAIGAIVTHNWLDTIHETSHP